MSLSYSEKKEGKKKEKRQYKKKHFVIDGLTNLCVAWTILVYVLYSLLNTGDNLNRAGQITIFNAQLLSLDNLKVIKT